MADSPVYEKLTQALLESVADEILAPGAESSPCTAASRPARSTRSASSTLSEHLERLTARDLRQLETHVPLDTLKTVVDLAVEIGREGREGKPVGTLFVVGDTRKVLACSHPTGFDPVKGYSRKERNLNDPRVREGIKEIAQMDGAFIVAPDGTVEAAARYVDAPATNITLSKGLGARHWAAAAITPGDQVRGGRRERIERHGPHLSERRSHAAHRALPPPDEVEGFRIRAAGVV